VAFEIAEKKRAEKAGKSKQKRAHSLPQAGKNLLQ
jgi:hypothetical protein